MSVNIKIEKVVNENQNAEFTDSNYISSNDCQSENLKVSLSKQQSKVQQSHLSILESKIEEMKKSIATLENEITSLKRSNHESSNIIAEKNKFLNIVYSTINNLEVKENIPVTNPKTAVLKLNKYQVVTKELRDQVIDNKIILMTLCRILGCSNTKIIQSLKDIINENETIKQKFKVYEQFYQRSVATMNQMSSDLHLNGFDKTISTRTESNPVCSIHSESFDNWHIKMTNLRSKCLNKADKINSKSCSYVSKSGEFNGQFYAKKPISVREETCLPNHFDKNIPPPLPIFPFHPYSPRLGILPSILPTPHMMVPFPQCNQFRNSRSANYRNSRKSNNLNTKNKAMNLNKQNTKTDVPSIEKENPDKNSITTNFEINSNVFDWQNCSSQQAKEELLKLEKKMLEDLSPITSSSNGTRCVSPSISLVEDKLEIWDYDSDSDFGEVKRCKWGI